MINRLESYSQRHHNERIEVLAEVTIGIHRKLAYVHIWYGDEERPSSAILIIENEGLQSKTESYYVGEADFKLSFLQPLMEKIK